MQITDQKLRYVESTESYTTLTIISMNKDDMGKYKVVVANDLGRDECTGQLYYECVPQIVVPDRNIYQIHESDECIKLKLTFTGDFGKFVVAIGKR